MNFESLDTAWPLSKIVASAGLIFVIWLVRSTLARLMLRQSSPSELRRRWLVNLRNAALMIALFGLIAIWLSDLHNLVLSWAAVAVALVVAGKEFLLCITGSVLRMTTNAFSVGDRIEVTGYRGDVIDITPFTTTILEVGPGRAFHLRTGRAVQIPNSIYLTQAVINESFMKSYAVHAFSVPLKMDQDWRSAQAILLEAAHEECAPYIEDARRYMQRLEEAHALTGLPMSPRVSVQLAEADKINLLVRLPVKISQQGPSEQNVLRKFLERFRPAPGGSAVESLQSDAD